MASGHSHSASPDARPSLAAPPDAQTGAYNASSLRAATDSPPLASSERVAGGGRDRATGIGVESLRPLPQHSGLPVSGSERLWNPASNPVPVELAWSPLLDKVGTGALARLLHSSTVRRPAPGSGIPTLSRNILTEGRE